MKVMIIANTYINKIANVVGLPRSYGSGWLDGLVNRLMIDYIDIDIRYITLYNNTTGKSNTAGYIDDRFSYQLIHTDSIERFSPEFEDVFADAISSFQPTIVEIFGTEFPHTLSAIKACQRTGILDKTVIHIQGLISSSARVFLLGLPDALVKGSIVRKIFNKTTLIDNQQAMAKRGEYEIEAVRIAKNVCGRTAWDEEQVKIINPSINYYYGGEILRDDFYTSRKWNIEKCKKHSIFISSALYPLKGAHFIIQALPSIIEQFPDTVLYIPAMFITEHYVIFQDDYKNYLGKLIRMNKLASHVKLLGQLSTLQMIEQYQNAHCFVNCSTVENSSNAIGEAMMIGTPIVASSVGGTPTLIPNDGTSGILYECNDVSELSSDIITVFNGNTKAVQMSKNEIKRSEAFFDRKHVSKELHDLYHHLNNTTLVSK